MDTTIKTGAGGLRASATECECKIEAGLGSVQRGDLLDGDEVMRELKAMSKARRTAASKKPEYHDYATPDIQVNSR